MRYIELFENNRASLFHATQANKACEIIKSNTFKAWTRQKIDGKVLYGVSFTRLFEFAKDWDTTGIIFEIDQNLLRNTNRIVPYNWYARPSLPTQYRTRRGEFEEFAIGEVKNVDKLLRTLWISEQAIDLALDMDVINYQQKNILTSHSKVKFY